MNGRRLRIALLYILICSIMEDTSNFLEKMMELGIGMSVLQQMPKMMEGVMPNITTSSPNATSTPPPVQQQTGVYIVVENSQAGPFSHEDLVKLIQNDMLSQNTLVWKVGMANWQPASQVPEVNKLFILAKVK